MQVTSQLRSQETQVTQVSQVSQVGPQADSGPGVGIGSSPTLILFICGMFKLAIVFLFKSNFRLNFLVFISVSLKWKLVLAALIDFSDAYGGIKPGI